MRLWILCAIALAVSPLASAPAAAEAPPACQGKALTGVEGLAEARTKRAEDLVNARGVLWRIDKAGLAPSYLYGTIHSTDDSALAVARRASERIAGAKVVATELGSLDAVAKANAGASAIAKALDRDHDTFEQVPPKDRAEVEKLLSASGYPSEFAHHLKLWFLAILTAMPPCETRREALGMPEVDQFLAETAMSSGVKVVALETAGEQIDTLAGMRPEIAASLLTVAARDPGLSDDVYATMLRLYQESRPAEILPITDAISGMSGDERAAEDEFVRLLLTGRNATMAERAAPLLEKGGAVIAVGALHLPGKDGLVERFRAMGYAATEEW
jgi:uncharacterized protein YbaP (TraB family)